MMAWHGTTVNNNKNVVRAESKGMSGHGKEGKENKVALRILGSCCTPLYLALPCPPLPYPPRGRLPPSLPDPPHSLTLLVAPPLPLQPCPTFFIEAHDAQPLNVVLGNDLLVCQAIGHILVVHLAGRWGGESHPRGTPSRQVWGGITSSWYT